MGKLKLGPLEDDKPVKISIELPAALHRDLLAYAEILGRENGQDVEPAKLASTGTARSENARRGAYVDPVSTTQTDRRARAIYIAADSPAKLPPIMMESHRIRRSPPSREM
jgi:hypothetical protein